KTANRYDAACAAALAGCARGKDAAKLDENQKRSWRKQALEWLRADLALWGKELEKNTPPARALIREKLQHWKMDPDLARVRDAARLAKRPAAERQAWEQLWADVDALFKRAQAKK